VDSTSHLHTIILYTTRVLANTINLYINRHKKNRAYPEAKHGHGLPSLETPIKALRKGFGGPGAHQGKETGVRNER
jgi:hypothetical protein